MHNKKMPLIRLQGSVSSQCSHFRGKAHKSYCSDRRQFGRGRDTSPNTHSQPEPPKQGHTENLLSLVSWKSRCLAVRDHLPFSLCGLSHSSAPREWVPSLLISASPLGAARNRLSLGFSPWRLQRKKSNQIKQSCSPGTASSVDVP